MRLLCCLAFVPRPYVDQVDAFLVAQLAGGQFQRPERDLRDEFRAEGIGHVERGAAGLPGIGRTRQFILLVRDVEQVVRRVGPDAVRFARAGEERRGFGPGNGNAEASARRIAEIYGAEISLCPHQ